MRERAKGIAQCYIVSLRKELLRRRGVSFHELIQSEVVFFNCLSEIIGVEGHVIHHVIFLIWTGDSRRFRAVRHFPNCGAVQVGLVSIARRGTSFRYSVL